MSNIAESDIVQLGSILLGFSGTQLQLLRINSTSTIESLGGISGWNSNQVYSRFLYNETVLLRYHMVIITRQGVIRKKRSKLKINSNKMASRY